MAFGNTPKDAQGIPISSVYTPDTGFLALQGSKGTSTDGSNNTSTPVNLNLSQVLDNPISAKNPVISESASQNAARNGEQFVVSVAFTATDVTSGLSIVHVFNNSQAVTATITGIRAWYSGAAGTHPIVKIAQTTLTDSNAVQTVTPANKKPGGSSSLMTVTSNKSASQAGPANPAGTVVDVSDLVPGQPEQLLQNGSVYILPAGAVNGLEIALNAPSGASGITIDYMELA